MQRSVAFQLPEHGYRLALPRRRRDRVRDWATYLAGEDRYRRAIHAAVLALALAPALASMVRAW